MIVVTNGYAIHFSLDGTMALWESSTLPDGIYDENEQECDAEPMAFLTNIIDAKTNIRGLEQFSVKDFVYACIHTVITKGQVLENVPKMTKALATSLSKINEPMTFGISDDNYHLTFLCFGIRPILMGCAQSLVPGVITVLPELYYACTNFKGAVYGVPSIQTIVVCDESKMQGGVMIGLDVYKQADYRKTGN